MHHVGGHFGGADDAGPRIRFKAGHAAFSDGGEFRLRWQALCVADTERAHFAGAHMLQRGWDAGEHQLHFAGEQRDRGGAAAFVGHVNHVDFGLRLEEFQRKVIGVARAG